MEMKTKLSLFAALLLVFVLAIAVRAQTLTQKPFPGLVPNKETAQKMASLLADSLLGKENESLAYIAKDKGSYWLVQGYVATDEPVQARTPTFTIDKKTARTSLDLR
jgi:hypothetical protein